MRYLSPILGLIAAWSLVGCGGSEVGSLPGGTDPNTPLTPDQTEFTSTSFASNGGGGRGGNLSGEGAVNAPTAGGDTTAGPGANANRTVEETDVYRLLGDRLYVLNGYRGLLVFDVSNVDDPKLIGRSPVFGTPVEMIVRDGLAVVVVSDWIGSMDDGTPFHGSIVRGLDVTDPSNIKVTGEAKLGGWIRDTRVVGDVLYAVSDDEGYTPFSLGGSGVKNCYSADGGSVSSGSAVAQPGIAVGGPAYYGSSKALVSSVSFAGGNIQSKSRYEVPGYSGIFNVTQNAILFAHDVVQPPPATEPSEPMKDDSAGSSGGAASGGIGMAATGGSASTQPTAKAALDYLDISDPGGLIKPRGTLTFDGAVQSYGTDNGRWNLDFADGKFARVFGCGQQYCNGGDFVLVTADFTNPDAPKVASRLNIPAQGWSPAVRFDRGRLYVAPQSNYYDATTNVTPLYVFDVTSPEAPMFAGSTNVNGMVWNFTPAGSNLFTLGQSGYDPNTGTWESKITVNYLNVEVASNPTVLGSTSFGENWAWTPAAGTFKAFIKNDQEGLVVLPFSGWSSNYYTYNNGVQLIEFTPTTVQAKGAANTKGWVERGIFVKGRIVSLSDQALAVVDYTDRAQPKVVKELTIARHIVSVQADENQVVTLSTDFWGKPTNKSELVVVPPAAAEETESGNEIARLELDGQNAQVFKNGDFTYVLSYVTEMVDCAKQAEQQGAGEPKPGADIGAPMVTPNQTPVCYDDYQQFQVVQITNGGATKRGKLRLPQGVNGWNYGWDMGWCGAGWWGYSNVVQVGGDKLAFQTYNYDSAPDGNGNYYQVLSVLDASNPDAPVLGKQVVTQQNPKWWWGNVKAVGDQLFVTHEEWVVEPSYANNQYRPGVVRYFLDRVDLSVPGEPKITQTINVPGILAGASTSDPNVLYFVDYQYSSTTPVNRLNVARLQGNLAYLQSSTPFNGWLGSMYVQNDRIYTSFQHQVSAGEGCYRDQMELLEVDMTNPRSPVTKSTTVQGGWGWLMGVQGDVALMQSGWGNRGFDLFKLTADGPKYDKFVRTNGWGTSSIDRVGNKLYVASGMWGVQAVDLQ